MRILIVNPFGIGDVLFTTPIIRAVKEKYPDSFIGYWCNQRTADILKNNRNIDKIFALSRGDIKNISRYSKFKACARFLDLFFKLKKERFEVCFDFSLDHRYGLLAKLIGIKKRIGLDYKKRGRFLTHKITIDGFHLKHVVEYYLELLKFLQIEPRRVKLELYLDDNQQRKAKDLLYKCGIDADDLLIGVVCGGGASWGKDAILKHWPLENFASLIDRLIEELKAKVIILGDPTERAIADKMSLLIKNQVVDLVGKTTLEEFASLIGAVRLLVTNDGGPLHVAVALGVKTVSVFGPVDDAVYGPYPSSPDHVVINKCLPCRPCYQNFRIKECARERECLTGITVSQVFNVIRGTL
jgi:lipopolysaccharide heptosyltransferase II